VFYVGGGPGVYLFEERSDLADDSENVDESHASYHVLVGGEARATDWISVALEGMYTTVPNAIGDDGISEFFGEENLGGFTIQVKFIVGK
jgi:hypothetical protein